MKKIMLIVMGIFIVAFVSGYLPHEQNTDLTYSFTSNNATECNITTGNTPGGVVTINQIATQVGNTFNSTINSGNFTQDGDYCYNIVCSDGTKAEGGSFCREVTISGSSEIGAGESLSLFGSLIVMILVGSFFFILSFRINATVGKISFIVLASIMLLMVVFYSMVIVQQNLGGFESLIEGYSTFFTVLKILGGVAFTALMIFSLLVAIRMYKFKRGFID